MSGGGGLTPWSGSALTFQPSPCRAISVGGVGPLLAPVSLAEMLRVQMPLEADSSLCLSL